MRLTAGAVLVVLLVAAAAAQAASQDPHWQTVTALRRTYLTSPAQRLAFTATVGPLYAFPATSVDLIQPVQDRQARVTLLVRSRRPVTVRGTVSCVAVSADGSGSQSTRPFALTARPASRQLLPPSSLPESQKPDCTWTLRGVTALESRVVMELDAMSLWPDIYSSTGHLSRTACTVTLRGAGKSTACTDLALQTG